MKFAMLTAYTENIKEYAMIGVNNKTAYCNKYNIPLIVDTTVPPSGAEWVKLIILVKYLANYDWLFWTDADALVMNSDIKLTPPTCKEDLVLSYDRNTLNFGNFWIRNCPWGYDFLMRCYCRRSGCWFGSDNGAVMQLLEENPEDMDRTKVVSQRLFNSYPHNGTYKQGDFMIHFAGPYDKPKLMDHWSKLAT